jgi:AraC family transcriptional activator of pobA
LKDVARAVSLSPGHLTTVVRRKTGRTVLEWIAERRMVEARRLLVQTDLAVEEVGRRVGYGHPGYFVRTFRRAHGSTPLGWRRAGRP